MERQLTFAETIRKYVRENEIKEALDLALDYYKNQGNGKQKDQIDGLTQRYSTGKREQIRDPSNYLNTLFDIGRVLINYASEEEEKDRKSDKRLWDETKKEDHKSLLKYLNETKIAVYITEAASYLEKFIDSTSKKLEKISQENKKLSSEFKVSSQENEKLHLKLEKGKRVAEWIDPEKVRVLRVWNKRFKILLAFCVILVIGLAWRFSVLGNSRNSDPPFSINQDSIALVSARDSVSRLIERLSELTAIEQENKRLVEENERLKFLNTPVKLKDVARDTKAIKKPPPTPPVKLNYYSYNCFVSTINNGKKILLFPIQSNKVVDEDRKKILNKIQNSLKSVGFTLEDCKKKFPNYESANAKSTLRTENFSLGVSFGCTINGEKIEISSAIIFGEQGKRAISVPSLSRNIGEISILMDELTKALDIELRKHI